MNVREATIIDIPTINELAHKIWNISYKGIITDRQIEYMLELIYSKESLLTQITDGHQFILLEDEIDNNLVTVGYASFSKKNTDNKIVRLHKLYVLPSVHKKGYGKFLLNYIMTYAKNQNCNLIELNVNRNNPALQFYNRQGFGILREEDINIGGGYYMNDYVMQRTL